jgi:DNA polymerase-3 subunit beta
MNITIVRDSFAEILQKASYFTSNKITDLKILKAVLINANQNTIKINTTNINEYFSGEIGGKVMKTGSVLVELKTLIEIVKNLTDTKIKLEKKENQLVITSSSGEVKLVCLDESNFPQFENVEETIGLPKEIFADSLLKPVIFSCAIDEARPILTGLCFDFKEKEIDIVGTDGFRLSLQKTPKTVSKLAGQKIIFSSKSLISVFKVFKEGSFKACLSQNKDSLLFKSGGVVVLSKTLEGEYPPYDKVVPQDFETSATIKTKDFLEAVRASSLFAKESSSMLNLSFSDGQLIINSAGAGVGEAVFKIALDNFSGKENKIVFNYRYLLDYLSNHSDEEIIFEMNSAYTPGVFRGKKNPGFLHIIMPIRSQE